MLSFHHLFAGLTAAALGGGALAFSAHSTTGPAKLDQAFTASDEAVFTGGFETSEGVCEIGYEPHDFCFEQSHLEERVVEGQPFPDNMYPLALEWRANLALSRKPDTLKTVRVGRTIALMDRETRMVVDTMRLGGSHMAENETQRAG